jgi:hypothetical protein
VRARHGFTPRTGWIAHVKELNGLSLRPTHNRGPSARVVPCPPDRRPAIEEALRHFGMLWTAPRLEEEARPVSLRRAPVKAGRDAATGA